MRPQSILLILFVLMSFLTHSQALESYTWKNRILLLCEKGETLTRSKTQIGMFSEVLEEVKERQLLFLVYDGHYLMDQKSKVISRTKIGLPEEDFEGILLIGKDGGVKYESDFYVSPEDIFEIIDSMPMRRAEMKRKND